MGIYYQFFTDVFDVHTESVIFFKKMRNLESIQIISKNKCWQAALRNLWSASETLHFLFVDLKRENERILPIFKYNIQESFYFY